MQKPIYIWRYEIPTFLFEVCFFWSGVQGN